MKYIMLHSILFLSFLLFFGCGPTKPTNSGNTTATTPQNTQRGQTIHIRTSNKGSITSLDMNVVFPSGTQQSLFDYNGDISINGTIDATPACLKGRRSFNCKAQLSVGNITANNCSINNHSITLRIFIKRGENLKETYSVTGAEVITDQSCFLKN